MKENGNVRTSCKGCKFDKCCNGEDTCCDIKPKENLEIVHD